MIDQKKWALATSSRDAVVTEHPAILQEIASGETPAVLIRNFFSAEACKEVVRRMASAQTDIISQFNYAKFDGSSVVVKNVGPFLMQYLADQEAYFREARRADGIFAGLFRDIPDPRVEVRALLGRLLPDKKIAVADENGVPYSSAVIRYHEDGEGAPIHRDKALADAQGWAVSKYETQLSAVLNLQKPHDGGELVIFRRAWTADTDSVKKRGTLGYPEFLVRDSDYCAVEAQEGDLYILNPGFFHEIKPSFGSRPRVTLGTFFAFADDDPRVVCWS